VFNNLHHFRKEGPLAAWIRKIMVRASLEQLDSNVKHKDQIPIHDLPIPNHVDYIKENMTYEQMMKWLDLLPPGYRNIFTMYVLDDLSHVEIAATLGITESTSRTQFFKARKFLQERLSHVLNQYV
jgi:RNA polymerase sigma-70 factor (ECF subfamily)